VELLGSAEKFTPADFERMLVDQRSIPAAAFRDLLLELAERIWMQPVLQEQREAFGRAVAELRNWDGTLSADSVAAAVYQVVQCYAMRRLFEPWLGPLTDTYLGHGFDPVLNLTALPYLDSTPLVLLRLLRENKTDWFRDDKCQPTTREALLAVAVSDAFTFLTRKLGSDVGQWRWGRLHVARFPHPLGRQKPLHLIFDRGPYPLGGDANTVWQASFLPSWPAEPANGFTASWRQVMDVSDWDNCVGVHTTGQSGHPASKHYADMIPLWLKGEYHPLLWSRAKVEANAEARLVLEPGRD
jgi:penicillin amidase